MTNRQAQENFKKLGENPYPGRGLASGINNVADMLVQVYWVMGRSESSRARKLVRETDPDSETGRDLVRTDPVSMPEGTDTSLIIYNAMRSVRDEVHVVSNGDQTDTIVNGERAKLTVPESLRATEYEPDAPNFTPRISVLDEIHGKAPQIGISQRLSQIYKKPDGKTARRHSMDTLYAFRDRAVGKCIHTYEGNGEPLPPFTGSPFEVPLGETVEEIAHDYWDTLNSDNRVGLVVKGIRLATLEELYTIVNVHE